MGFLGQGLSQTHHIAVAGQHNDALYKGLLLSVIAEVLVFQEPHQGLGGGQSQGLHGVSPLSLKNIIVGVVLPEPAVLRIVDPGLQGSPSKCRMPQA